jgi:hypothetical protein
VIEKRQKNRCIQIQIEKEPGKIDFHHVRGKGKNGQEKMREK